jgi:hypothetical protein
MERKKRIRSAIGAVLIVLAVFAALDDPAGAAFVKPGVAAVRTAAENEKTPDAPEKEDVARLALAARWAEAVKSRDGRAQYALMTRTLQKALYDEFSALNWVTGTSSPWVDRYVVQTKNGGASVALYFADSTGPSGIYRYDLRFAREDGVLKIGGISEPKRVDAFAPSLRFGDLTRLIGKTRDELLAAVDEKPVAVDEGGLGFQKAGIRVWFDAATHTTVAQVLILTNAIDINGVRLGDDIGAFKKVFGEPVRDENGDARFVYGELYLSVVYDTASGRSAGVYILKENV